MGLMCWFLNFLFRVLRIDEDGDVVRDDGIICSLG